MSDTSTISLQEAARALSVPVHVLRRAIFAGKLAAPPHVSATAAIPAAWLVQAKATVAAPGGFSWAAKPKVPAFARYEGTSAWRKYRTRVREYNAHTARQHKAATAAAV